MRANFDLFILKLQSLVEKPHVIILTEIWIEEHEVPQYRIEKFVSFANCNCQSRSGGVLIYLSEELTGHRIVTNGMRSADVLWLEIKLEAANIPFVFSILGIYRLHNHSVDSFVQEIDDFLNKIDSPNLVISGDLNIDLLKNTSQTDNYLTKMASHGLASLIDQPTRITSETSTCIDHIFFRRNARTRIEYTTLVVHSEVSDHLMTVLYLKSNHPVKNNHRSETVIKIDYNKLRESLNKYDWSCILSQTDASVGFDLFIKTLQQFIQDAKKEIAIHTQVKLKPWMNDNLLSLIIRKNALYKKTLKHPNDIVLLTSYKKFKNTIQVEVRKTKNTFYQRQFNDNHKNPKKQWKTIYELTGNKDKSDRKIFLYDYNNTLVQDQSRVANIFNDFFLTIADELRTNIELEMDEISRAANFSEPANNRFPQGSLSKNSIFFYPTTKSEIINIVNKLESSKAPGFDEITPIVIKNIISSIENVLVHLINLSLNSGVFPDVLKKAILKPLYKKNEKTNPTNYRPIALLSIFSKIIEKVVKCRLVNYLDNLQFFSNKQYGFRSKRNTSDALLNFMTQVYEEVNKGKCSAGIFVDVMKAFDTVDHEILLSRMYDAGVRGIPFKWFKSYLNNRSHITRVGNVFSNTGIIRHGIPQGSVLSGPLFLIYVNNLCEGAFKGNLVAFADDIALFYSSTTLKQLRKDMQEDINLLRLWFTKNYMVMSPKTKYIIFNLSRDIAFSKELKYHSLDCTADLDCDCRVIEQVTYIKYLGLNVDAKLSWKIHIDSLKMKLLKYIRIFYMLKTVCKKDLLKTVYYALISSKIEYGLEIWGGTYITTLKPIIILQKCFIRLVSNKAKLEHTEPLFKDLNILPFRNLYIFKVLKIFYDKSGDDRHDIGLRSQTLRRCANVFVPKPNSTAFKNFFLYLAPKFFNKMPDSIKTCENKRKFCKMLKNYLIDNNNTESFYNTLV